MNTYRFIVTLFGEKHVGMLLTNLFSIKTNAPSSAVSVFWQDISEKTKAEFKLAFPDVDYNETSFNLSSDKIQRISSKMLFWNFAAKKFKGQNLCFLDVDTFVLQDVGHFFEEDFDILFTDKDERFPLNTGVLLCKGDQYDIFFEEWLKKTVEILSTPKLVLQSMSTKYPFGGGDQMSFYNLVGYQRKVRRYMVSLSGQNLILLSKPCTLLNETRSTKISADTHIIHYKGGWQMVMLEGEDFTRGRTKKDSWEMYLLYLNTHKAALEYLNKKASTEYTFGSFGIQIPKYLNKLDLKEDKIQYFFFHIFWLIKRLAKKLIRL